MKLEVINSGSDGNTYLVDCMGEILVLDCGMKLMDVKKTLNFNLSNIVGCFVSHIHSDHSKYRKEYEKCGIPIFAPYETECNRANFKCGGYTLQAFKIPHDETPNYGLVIKHISGSSMLYLTDYTHTEYVFKALKIKHYLIEVNYQEKYVDFNSANAKHKVGGHCSLETTLKFLRANVTNDTKSIIACHLGNETTNPSEIVKEIRNIAPSNVKVDYARRHTVYELGD